jgi:hypothetical protein
MPGMPYHLEKGGWLEVLEDYLNGAPGRSEKILALLRDPQIRVSDTGFLQSPSLDKDPDYETVPKRVGHLRRDWFGYVGEDLVPEEPQDPFLDQLQRRLDAEDLGDLEFGGIPADECQWQNVLDFLTAIAPHAHSLRNWPVTGFWVQYFGNVEEIVRQTLIRTIELSLGLEHGEDVPSGGPRRVLPVELFWKCPQRWFEGWVTWRWDETHGTGQVTTIFATPGSGKPVLQNPLDGRDAKASPSSLVTTAGQIPVGPGPSSGRANPGQAAKGMWVVTHQHHLEMPDLPDHFPSASGDWAIPEFGPTYVGLCDVVCVEPSEQDGGVNPYGRVYREPADPVGSAGGTGGA